MVGNLNTWRSHWCLCHSLKIDWEPCIRDLKCATSLQLGAPPVCNFNLMHFKWQVFLKFLLLYFFRHYCTVESQWKEYLRVFWPHGRSLSWLWQVWRQDRSSQYAARCDFRDGIICWFGADQGREASASWHYCPTRGCLMKRMEQLTWLSPARWPAPTLLVLKPKQVLLWQRHARGRWETLLMLANVRASSSSPLRWKRWVAFTLEPSRKPAVWEALPKSDARQCLDSLFCGSDETEPNQTVFQDIRWKCLIALLQLKQTFFRHCCHIVITFFQANWSEALSRTIWKQYSEIYLCWISSYKTERCTVKSDG